MKRQRTGGHAGGNSGAKRRSRPGGRRDLAGGDGGGGTGDGGDGNWPCHVFIQIGPACGVFPVDVRVDWGDGLITLAPTGSPGEAC